MMLKKVSASNPVFRPKNALPNVHGERPKPSQLKPIAEFPLSVSGKFKVKTRVWV